MNDPILEIAEKLMKEKNEVIDLFCKTFLLSQQPKSLDDLRDLFENYALDIKMMHGTHMHWQYSLKLKEYRLREFIDKKPWINEPLTHGDIPSPERKDDDL